MSTAQAENIFTAQVGAGDVFVEIWGYDQTNVNCYVVTRRTPKSVAIKPCGSKIIDGRVLPNPDVVGEFTRSRLGKPNKDGEIIKRLSSGYKGSPWISMTSYSGASLWDGSETFYDTRAAGYAGH